MKTTCLALILLILLSGCATLCVRAPDFVERAERLVDTFSVRLKAAFKLLNTVCTAERLPECNAARSALEQAKIYLERARIALASARKLLSECAAMIAGGAEQVLRRELEALEQELSENAS